MGPWSSRLRVQMKTESYVTFMDGPGADASERDDETADEDHDEDPLQTVVDRSTVRGEELQDGPAGLAWPI